MNPLVRCACFLIFSSWLAAAADASIPSPNDEFAIDYSVHPVNAAFNESFQEAKVKREGDTIWSYGSIARDFAFSWAPDSSGFLMAITHASRSTSLLFIRFEEGMDAYPVSIDLARIQEEVAASLPDRPGSSATVCRVPFSQRFLGKNADSLIELDFADPSQPRWKILSITPR